MNYRHAYHAANFADVVKHSVLARILFHLNQKPAAYRVIDVHAGAGLYDLGANEAARTGEWRAGLARVRGAAASPALAAFLQPWLAAVAAEGGTLYPGSPLLAKRMTRPGDALVFNELHPGELSLLRSAIGHDRRVKYLGIDAYAALKSLLPPPERRALVVIDPPFEEPDEFARLAAGIKAALKRFANGCYLIWYPVKSRLEVERFLAALAVAGLPKTLRLELATRALSSEAPKWGEAGAGLGGTGVLVINPPWTLYPDALNIWPELTAMLASGPGADGRVDWLVGEEGPPPTAVMDKGE